MTATGRDARVGNHAVQVFRGGWGLPERVGPFEGLRAGPLLVYVLPLPDDFAPWPGRPRADTVLVDLSLGVSMSRPCWQWRIRPDGRRTPGLEAERAEPATWYVDLVSVTRDPRHGYAEFPPTRFADLVSELAGSRP